MVLFQDSIGYIHNDEQCVDPRVVSYEPSAHALKVWWLPCAYINMLAKNYLSIFSWSFLDASLWGQPPFEGLPNSSSHPAGRSGEGPCCARSVWSSSQSRQLNHDCQKLAAVLSCAVGKVRHLSDEQKEMVAGLSAPSELDVKEMCMEQQAFKIYKINQGPQD